MTMTDPSTPLQALALRRTQRFNKVKIIGLTCC